MNKITFLQAIDNLPDKQLEDAILDFISERKLLGEFLVWLEKWKAVHGIK